MASNANGTNMTYHEFHFPNDDTIPIIQMTWWDVEATFHVYFMYGSRPTFDKYAEKRVVQQDWIEARYMETSNYTVSFTPNTTDRSGDLYIGVQEIGNVDRLSEMARGQPKEASKYRLTVSDFGCLSWNEEEEKWKLANCNAEVDLDKTITHCQCRMTGSRIAVGTMTLPVPNAINFMNAFKNFRNLSDNAVVFSIVVSEFILYIILMVFLSADQIKRKTLPEVSLIPPDRMPAPHVYQLTVTTGSMLGAGTTSRVAFQLFGSEGTTPVKMLNPGGEALVRGSTLHFVMPVRESLGEVMLLYIWHDNSGEGDRSSWFLQKVFVRDIETDVISYFICNDWLSEDKGDGEVQKVVHASTELELAASTNVFNEATRDVLYDQHLWASALMAAPGSSFTKAQRLSCCFTLLNTMMLASAMWYQKDDTTADTKVYNLGIARFTAEELYISLMSMLTVAPVNLMIVQLFRKETPLSLNTPEMSIRRSKRAPRKIFPPAKPGAQLARKKKELTKKSVSTLLDLFLLFVFVAVFFYLAQADTDQRAFYETRTLSNTVLQEYNTISTPDQLYGWLEEVLLPTLFPSAWYNGRKMKFLDQQFAQNTESFRFGPPRLTQRRKIPGTVHFVWHNGRAFGSEPSGPGNTSDSCWRFAAPNILNHPNFTSDCSNNLVLEVLRNYEIAVSFVRAMEGSGFVDKHTESLAININFYNPSLKLFSGVNILLKRSGELGFEHFVDVTPTAWWDACFKHILGLVVFINTIALLRAVRFTQTIGKLLALPGIMKEELVSFLVVAAVAFVAFLSSGHLIFGSNTQSYSDMYRTTLALFEMVLGVFLAQDLVDSNPLLGPIYFSAFMIFIFTLLVNVLMTIICEAISADVDTTHDQELAEHMWSSFQAILGAHSVQKKEDKQGVLKKEELQANLRTIREQLDESLNICDSILPRSRVSRTVAGKAARNVTP
ncbi:PREDICTED: uncharacterized protein LOC109466590 [Branchiostoma belcheri]|uniref:Uncharacterized protein LOC109466590 n=1 Tax=Branchiostoma belcheri TaxID=7741 RepID=A0A6P4XTA3_BRABE|nr:PREDICTED: uncharacterized protein LOC109466590 [Branchiostoma belcheri]